MPHSVVKLMRCMEHLDSTAIAEGIENVEQLQAVQRFGIKLGQGYLWGRPS